jgi:hypothetical protein
VEPQLDFSDELAGGWEQQATQLAGQLIGTVGSHRGVESRNDPAIDRPRAFVAVTIPRVQLEVRNLLRPWPDLLAVVARPRAGVLGRPRASFELPGSPPPPPGTPSRHQPRADAND